MRGPQPNSRVWDKAGRVANSSYSRVWIAVTFTLQRMTSG
jgi:hypothetical protein